MNNHHLWHYHLRHFWYLPCLSQRQQKINLKKKKSHCCQIIVAFLFQNTRAHLYHNIKYSLNSANRWNKCSAWGDIAKCSYRKSSSARQAFRALQHADTAHTYTHSYEHMHTCADMKTDTSKSSRPQLMIFPEKGRNCMLVGSIIKHNCSQSNSKMH